MDNILTFVLIIASSSYGRPVTTIPGYPTLVACERAVAAYTEGYKKSVNAYGGSYAFCVPGPDQRP